MRVSKSLLVSTVTASLISSSWAFVLPAQSKHFNNNNIQVTPPRKHSTTVSSLHVIPPELMIADHLDTTHMLQNIQLLVSDAVTTKENSGGWWDNYLNLYKTCLLFVHDTIDQPLRNTRWDQTWGVSIAVFTTGKIEYHTEYDYIQYIHLSFLKVPNTHSKHFKYVQPLEQHSYHYP